jgi:hypothetical protein
MKGNGRTKIRQAALIAPIVLVVVSCGSSGKDDEPPRLIRYEIAEGTPPCPGCALTGPRVAPGSDRVLVLRLNVHYTARSYVRTGGNSDRCIYRVFGYSWWLPEHSFYCTPEREEMVIDDDIDTEAALALYGTDPRVKATLGEYETSSHRNISSQDLYDFPVRFVP